jgi:hypothetical protein
MTQNESHLNFLKELIFRSRASSFAFFENNLLSLCTDSSVQSLSTLGLTPLDGSTSANGALSNEKAPLAFTFHNGRLKRPFQEPQGQVE